MQLEALLNYTPMITSFLVLFAIYLMMALSLNLEYGFTGVPNFGHVFFLSVGAYTAGVLTARLVDYLANIQAGYCTGQAAMLRSEFIASNPHMGVLIFVLSLIIGAILGGLFGYAASYPALRLKEDFLAITLIFIGEIGRIVARNEEGIVCALTGLTGIAHPFSFIEEPHIRSIIYTALVLLFAVLTYVYTQRLANSPFGRLMKSIRDDELAARVLGKQVPKARGVVMIIGSSIAAVAGVLRTFYIQGVVADDFHPLITFIALSMVILGGMANNKGVILGALALTALDHFISPSFLAILGVRVEFDITYIKWVIIGTIMVLMLMFRPQGLIPEGPVQTPLLEISKSKEWERKEELELS